MHALGGVRCLFSRLSDVHDTHPIKERLPDNVEVFFLVELLLVHASVELEVVHELLMVDREN